MQAVKNKSLHYCKRPDRYSFAWNGVDYNNFDCVYIDPAALFVNGESQVSLE